MRSSGLYLLVALILSICRGMAGAQETEVHFNFGPSFTGERIAPGQLYDVLLFDVGYGKHFFPVGKNAGIFLVAGLQYGHTNLFDQGKRQFDLTSQLTAQLVWKWNDGALELGIGSGPGYQSSDSRTQVKGFVFANHGTVGLRLQLFHEKIFLVPQYRFRHMSNASTKQPNNGIDNHFVLLGLRVTGI